MSKKSFALRRPPVIATLCLIIGLAVLCGLGTWQVQRLGWKTDLMAAMNAEYARDPAATVFDRVTLDTAASRKPVFAYGTAKGRYLFDAEILVGPRTQDGVPGYHVITPLYFQDQKSGWVLVNRGWVPLDYKGDYSRAMKRTQYSITGSVRSIPAPNAFTPDNRPQDGQWFSIDAKTIETMHGIDGLRDDVMFYAQSHTPALPGPVASSARWMPKNDHFSYALFWFGMAGALLMIYILRFIVQRTS